MAISLSRMCQYGPVSYWRITSISVDCDANTVQVGLSGWMTQAAREAGALCFDGDFPGCSYTINTAALTLPAGMDPVSALKTSLYTYIEAQPEWAGGIDC